MIRPALALALTLAACAPTDVELGRAPVDAPIDAPAITIDASECRCRIPGCRDTPDCAAIGGACGGDMFCVGDLGGCRTDGECQATAPTAICTESTTSTAACAQ